MVVVFLFSILRNRHNPLRVEENRHRMVLSAASQLAPHEANDKLELTEPPNESLRQFAAIYRLSEYGVESLAPHKPQVTRPGLYKRENVVFTTGCSLRQSARFRARMLVLLILAGFLFAIEMWRSRFATAQSFADSQEPASILPAAGGDVDPGFNASVFEPMGFSGGLARQFDGKTIVFGSFTSVNGTARDGVARLNTDGSLDPSFSPSPR